DGLKIIGFYGNTVHDVQRGAAPVNRADPSHNDLGRIPRLSGAGRNLHSRDLSLKYLAERAGGYLVDLIRFNGSDGAGRFIPFITSISGNYHLVQGTHSCF